MLSINFLVFSTIFIFFILFYFIWAVYFTSLSLGFSKYINYNDYSLPAPRNYLVCLPFFNFFRFTFIYLFLFIFIFRSFNLTFFFKHISLEPFTFNLYLLIIIIFFCLICIFEKYFVQLKKAAISADFYTSLWIFFVFLPFAIFSNTLLTFFFFLELGSLSTIYLIISSKDFFYSNSKKKIVSSAYFNSVFFQFWASFFSSILLVYSIINFFFLFGTTEWSFLNFFLEVVFNKSSGSSKKQAIFSIYLFIFSILIKMGVSPFFFYKVEIYKGLPLIILFFYSIFYFLFYFILVYILFLYYFSTIIFFISLPIFFFLALAVLIFIGNLFNLFLLKNFFAMSSLVNSIMFFFLIFSCSL